MKVTLFQQLRMDNFGLALRGGKDKLFIFVAIGGVVLGLSFYFYGYTKTWELWNIPAYQLPFLDLRSILTAAESYRAGYNPTIANPFDPLGRRFNYPIVWDLVLESGVNQNWTIPLGIGIIGLFLIGVVLFSGKLNKLSIFFLLLGLFSPAALFGIERANVDLLFFFFLSLGLILLDVSQIASFLLLLVGILFKIFPLFGAGYFIGKDNKSSLKFILLGILFTAGYFLFTYSNMMTVFKNTLKGPDISYGLAVLPTYIKWETVDTTFKTSQPALYHLDLRANNILVRFPILPYFGAAAFLLIFSLLGLFRNDNEFQSEDLRNLRAFWLGAGVYIGTFLLGNNWDYRLVFLLFTLPQLAGWIKQTTRSSKFIVWTTVVTLFLSMWYFVLKAIVADFSLTASYIHPAVDQTIKWILFGSLIYLYASSLPRWIPDYIRMLPSKLKQRLRSQTAE
ncbi:MAG: hypothetical protein M1282_06975 [Chloroflexi bacterium]|nr:hypothetical protein [Chloroflexota bacterium]